MHVWFFRQDFGFYVFSFSDELSFTEQKDKCRERDSLSKTNVQDGEKRFVGFRTEAMTASLKRCNACGEEMLVF